MGQVYVGMSGWTFNGWRGNFYPKDLSRQRELEYASRQVNSIEINGTFYSLQTPTTFQRWYDATPKDFVFSLKAPRYITHIRRLKDVTDATANFFASGLLCLNEKLGPILWQFPPNVMLKDDRFEKFLQLLPYDTKSASRLAKKHTEKLDDRNVTKASSQLPIRHAFEFRHPSFMHPEFLEILKHHGVAVVFAHSGLKSPYMEDLTANFVYARMHGQEPEYRKGYSPEFIRQWHQRVKLWAQGKQPSDAQCVLTAKPRPVKRDVFIYFDNEAKEHAPRDAVRLSQLLQGHSKLSHVS